MKKSDVIKLPSFSNLLKEINDSLYNKEIYYTTNIRKVPVQSKILSRGKYYLQHFPHIDDINKTSYASLDLILELDNYNAKINGFIFSEIYCCESTIFQISRYINNKNINVLMIPDTRFQENLSISLDIEIPFHLIWKDVNSLKKEMMLL